MTYATKRVETKESRETSDARTVPPGKPEDTWRVVPGSSAAGEWSNWQLDDKLAEWRERRVTSLMEGNVLHFWTEQPFVKDVPVNKIPKMLTLTGLHDSKVMAKIDYDTEQADATSNAWRPPSDGRLGELRTEAEWRRAIRDQPMTSSKKRHYATAHAVVLAGLDGDECAAQREKGCKMLWELASQRERAGDFPAEAVDALLANVRDVTPTTRWYACSAAWCLVPFTAFRRRLAERGLVQMLVANLEEVMNHLDEIPEPSVNAWRACVGALSVCAVDKECRRRLLDEDPKMSVLLRLAEALAEDMNARAVDHWGVMLRVVEVYCSVLVRDGDARRALVANGAVRDVARVTALPGLRTNFAAGAAYAALACDEDAVAAMRAEKNLSSLAALLRDSVALTAEQLEMLLARDAAEVADGAEKKTGPEEERPASAASSTVRGAAGEGGERARGEGGDGGGGEGGGLTSAASASRGFDDARANRRYSNIAASAPMRLSEKVQIARATAEASVLALWGATCAVLASDAGAAGMPPGTVDTITAFAVRTLGKGEALGKVPESLAGCLCVLSKDPVIGATLIQGPLVGSVQSLVRPSCEGVVNGAGARAAASACVATLVRAVARERGRGG